MELNMVGVKGTGTSQLNILVVQNQRERRILCVEFYVHYVSGDFANLQRIP